MSIFQCDVCGAVENTATSDYWTRGLDAPRGAPKPPPLCSACDPGINKWHGSFYRRPAAIYKLASDGFLYSDEAIAQGELAWRMKIQGLTILGVPPDAYARAARASVKSGEQSRLAALFRDQTTPPPGYADRFEYAAALWLPEGDIQTRQLLAYEFRRRVMAEEQLSREYTQMLAREEEKSLREQNSVDREKLQR
jgi:hypothetical protein